MAKRPSTQKHAAKAKPAAADETPAPVEPAAEPAAKPSEVRRPPRAAVWIAVAVIVVGTAALVWARITGPQPAPEPPRADAALSALENRLTGVAAGLGVLEERVAEFDSRLAALEAAGDAAPTEDALNGLAARIDGVTDGLAALDDRIAAVEERLAALAETPPAEGGLVLSLEALDDRLGALEAASAATAVLADDPALDAVASEAERIAAVAADLDRRIAALEARPAPAGFEAAALLAVAQLRAALGGSGPFEAELKAVRAVAGSDGDVVAALDALALHAGAGIATPAMLRGRFAALAGEIVRAGYAPVEGSWLDRTFARLSELVTVRRVGDDLLGDMPEAIVARAEARLAAGDLAAVVAEVERLDDAPADAAADWLADARARLVADRALATLDARAVAALGGG